MPDLVRRDAPERDLGPGLGADVVLGLGNTATAGACASAVPAPTEQHEGRRHGDGQSPGDPRPARPQLSRDLLQPQIKPTTASNVAPRRLACTPYGSLRPDAAQTSLRSVRLPSARRRAAPATYLSVAMRFASILQDGAPLAVAIEGDRAVPIRGVTELGPATPLSLLRDPPLDRDSSLPAQNLTRRPVVPRPARSSASGSTTPPTSRRPSATHSDYPVLFTKFATTLTGPGDPIPLPPESARGRLRGRDRGRDR